MTIQNRILASVAAHQINRGLDRVYRAADAILKDNLDVITLDVIHDISGCIGRHGADQILSRMPKVKILFYFEGEAQPHDVEVGLDEPLESMRRAMDAELWRQRQALESERKRQRLAV